MPSFCAVVGCSNDHRSGKRFFSIPAVRTREGQATQELLERRRCMWLKAINRKGLDSKTVKSYHRVCSDHFISGRPSYVQFEHSIDWVPSLKLGYSKKMPAVPTNPKSYYRKNSTKLLATGNQRTQPSCTTACNNEPTGGLIMHVETSEDGPSDASPSRQEDAEKEIFEQEALPSEDKWKVMKSLLSRDTVKIYKNKSSQYTSSKLKAGGKKGRKVTNNCNPTRVSCNSHLEPQSEQSPVKPDMVVKAENIDNLEENTRNLEFGVGEKKQSSVLSDMNLSETESCSSNDCDVWPVMVLSTEDIKKFGDKSAVTETVVADVSLDRMEDMAQEGSFALESERQTLEQELQVCKPGEMPNFSQLLGQEVQRGTETDQSQAAERGTRAATSRKITNCPAPPMALKNLYEFTFISQQKPSEGGSAEETGKKPAAILRPALKYTVREPVFNANPILPLLNTTKLLSALVEPQTKLVNILKCYTCHQDFRSPDTFESHACPILEGESFPCLLCDTSVPRLKLQGHMMMHMQEQLIPHKCDNCGLRYRDKRSLDNHRLLDHSYICGICGMKFTRECNFDYHNRFYHKLQGRRRFTCKVCNQEFQKYSTMCTHMNQHMELIKYYCNVCKQGFAFINQLTKHMKKHNKQSNIRQCHECGKIFFHYSTFKTHTNMHEGIKPFECEICGKRFASRDGHKGHVLAHKGPPPFKCNLCEKGYYSACNLKNHKKDKHGESDVEASPDTRVSPECIRASSHTSVIPECIRASSDTSVIPECIRASSDTSVIPECVKASSHTSVPTERTRTSSDISVSTD